MSWINFHNLPFAPCSDVSAHHAADVTPFDDTTSDDTSDTLYDTPFNGAQTPQSKKRRPTLEGSESDALVRARKTRKLRDPHETAKIREKGACFLCQKKRKEVMFDCLVSSPLLHSS